MAPDAVRFVDGRIEVLAPLPPGERYLLIRYRIDENDFLLPAPGRTDRLEVYVREPGPEANFPPLTPSMPVELEPGNVYRSYVADNVTDASIRAEVASEPWQFRAEWLGLLLAALLGAAGVYGYRRRSGPTALPSGSPAARSREELLVEIATLDEEFSRMAAPSEEVRSAYEASRGRIVSQLKRSS
ncbi:hypothetical protein ACFL5A_02460 [Gemmatimonadota bacterium]